VGSTERTCGHVALQPAIELSGRAEILSASGEVNPKYGRCPRTTLHLLVPIAKKYGKAFAPMNSQDRLLQPTWRCCTESGLRTPCRREEIPGVHCAPRFRHGAWRLIRSCSSTVRMAFAAEDRSVSDCGVLFPARQNLAEQATLNAAWFICARPKRRSPSMKDVKTVLPFPRCGSSRNAGNFLLPRLPIPRCHSDCHAAISHRLAIRALLILLIVPNVLQCNRSARLRWSLF